MRSSNVERRNSGTSAAAAGVGGTSIGTGDIDSPRRMSSSAAARKSHCQAEAPAGGNSGVNRPPARKVVTDWADEEQERQYDLTPVDASPAGYSFGATPGSASNGTPEDGARSEDDEAHSILPAAAAAAAEAIDPWEQERRIEEEQMESLSPGSYYPRHRSSGNGTNNIRYLDNCDVPTSARSGGKKSSVFIVPGDIHPNMEHKQDEIEQLRLLAGKLSLAPDSMAAPALAR